ncbi:hypothetical protein FRB93_005481 [Tulasnella sp. JGI-2019a]|nr:hypothetical protein FRB93_005481 [Tulasnella sp. JGI-2019a]
MVRVLTAAASASLRVSSVSTILPSRDFNAPASTNPPRDTSSATIASSALLLLSQVEASLGNVTGSAY